MNKPKHKDWRYTGGKCSCGGFIIFNFYTENYICDNPECTKQHDNATFLEYDILPSR